MAPDPYGPRSELLGPLPVINHFLDRIGLADSLQRFLPHDDARLRLAPAVVVGVVEIVLSFHSIGRHYRGVVGAVIVFFRKAELGEDGRQAYDVSVAGDEPFQVNCREAGDTARSRFSRWLERGLVEALECWRQGE